MVKVLFVCTGNICRSPTAEGVFRHMVRQAGLGGRVETDSAGTQSYHVDEPPDRRSQAAARRRGVDMSDLRARRVDVDDFTRFDLILAMDRGHYADLRRMAPRALVDRVHLFMDFAPGGPQGREVPDPYYGDGNHFEDVLDMVEAASKGLLESIEQNYL